jgi:rsbT antagonist protein RsbS
MVKSARSSGDTGGGLSGVEFARGKALRRPAHGARGAILLVSIQIDLADQVALQLQDDLADKIVATGCHGVIIDISALDIVDSFVGRTLATIASISRVLDAETVVVGIRPAVAITLVELGLSLPGIRTALNVELGMDLLARERGAVADEDETEIPAVPAP